MMPRMRTATGTHHRRQAAAVFRTDVLTGLRNRPKTLPCKYFYDESGAQLFERICMLPEYYLTRTELSLMSEQAAAMADWAGPNALLIEFGSGSSTKTRLLLDQRRDWHAYMPVDISQEHLLATARRLATEYAPLRVLPCVADFSQPLSLVLPASAARRIIYFPGSTLGNFERRDAVALLRRSARLVGPAGGLLLGVDLVKDPAILLAAYNDSAGVTAAFNLNLLVRINRELGMKFPLRAFRHLALYDELAQRIEMRLICDRELVVNLDEHYFHFRAGEFIRTEYSHKYTLSSLENLLTASGWRLERQWTDARRWFAVVAARPSAS
jgi:L-histidine N-alpha-methyltransferase